MTWRAVSTRPSRQALATVLENFPADKAIIKRRAVRSAFKVGRCRLTRVDPKLNPG